MTFDIGVHVERFASHSTPLGGGVYGICGVRAARAELSRVLR